MREPNRIYDFIVENKFGWVGFNIEETEGENRSKIDPVTDRAMYENFFTIFYKMWDCGGRPFIVREFSDFHATMIRVSSDEMYYREPDETIPLAIITIDRLGDIYSFSPELASTKTSRYGVLSFGNVTNDSIDEKLLVRRPDIVNEIREGVDTCRRSCEYFRFCGGAYVSNRASEHGDFRISATSACTLHRKLLFDIVLAGLEERQRLLVDRN
jgi:uncharacterized protein